MVGTQRIVAVDTRQAYQEITPTVSGTAITQLGAGTYQLQLPNISDWAIAIGNFNSSAPLPTNTPPIAIDDTATVASNGRVAIAVLANDSDPEANPLTIIEPTNGTQGTDSFTYTLSDGNGGTAMGTVNVMVTAENQAPVAQPDDLSTQQGTPLRANVLANDADPDGQSLAVDLSVSPGTTPSNGNLDLQSDGRFIYTPNPGFTGVDSFTYTVSDGNGGTATATVNITVNPPIPVAADPIRIEAEDLTLGGSYQTESGGFASNGELIRLTNPDGTATTTFAGATGTYRIDVGYFDESDGEARLTVNIGGNQIDSWLFDNSPGGTRAEADNFTLRTIATELAVTTGEAIELIGLRDPSGENARVDFIEFTPVSQPTVENRPPVASSDAYTTSANSSLTIAAASLLSNDSDPDANNLDIVGIGQPERGTLADNNDGTFTYTPAARFVGADSFTYTVSDGNGSTATTTVNLTVLSSSSAARRDYSTATNGVIVNLQTQTVLQPLYGSLANPKLMPMGDSITEGDHSIAPVPGSYRTQFWQRAVDDGLVTADFSIDFVGSEEESNPVTGLGDLDHQGHRGWRIERVLNSRVQSAADVIGTYDPDVVMVLLGANNVLQGDSADAVISDLKDLVAGIQNNADANTTIVVSSLTRLDSSTNLKNIPEAQVQVVEEVNSRLAAEVANGQDVLFADVGGRLTVADINDGVHPTAAGYDRLGDLWYEAIMHPESFSGVTEIIGSPFSDRVVSGAGEDTLVGNGGSDTFVYMSSADGGDTITDFGLDDAIAISATGWGGTLAVGDIVTLIGNDNPVADSIDSTFLFNTGTGELHYDLDGIGTAAPTLLATLAGTNSLTTAQIELVA